MSISILPYLDESASEIIAAKMARNTAPASNVSSNDFTSILNENAAALSNHQAVSNQTAPAADLNTTVDLEAIFEEAANTYGVSKNLLKSIAKAESNFNPSAVSPAGAMGIMQLMPQTAASLGVSNPYDPRENIMGGACMIGSLLTKYNGDTALALAAYNAGSGNVEKYGGIPPFTETQNYVKKVLNGIGENYELPSASGTTLFDLTGDKRAEANRMLEEFFNEHNVTKDSLDLMVTLMKLTRISRGDA